MKERGIIFSGPMVRAILDGRKTQTRRVIPSRILHSPNLEVFDDEDGKRWHFLHRKSCPSYCEYGCGGYYLQDRAGPYGVSGDRLWVRETWWESPAVTTRMLREGADTWPEIVYDADCDEIEREEWRERRWKRRSSLYMRRDDARIDLEITGVRAERVQEITQDDAMAEGITVLPLQDANDPIAWWQSSPGLHQARTPTGSFSLLWDSLKPKRGFGWAANPWVWVIEFRALTPPRPGASDE